MDSLRDWITEEKNRDMVPFQDGYYITMELDQHIVSVKGSNVFPITYSLLANVSTKTSFKTFCCVVLINELTSSLFRWQAS